MATEIKVYASDFAILKYAQQGVNDHTSNPAKLDNQDILCFKFAPPSGDNKFKKVFSQNPDPLICSYLQGTNSTSTSYDPVFFAYALEEPFDAETVTYATKPAGPKNPLFRYIVATDVPMWMTTSTNGVKKVMRNGFALQRRYTDKWFSVATKGENRPYYQVTIDETLTIGLSIDSVSPADGSVIKTKPNVFTWATSESGLCLAEIEQASAVFRWRSGTSGTIHTISISGSTQSVTVPANTFAGTTSIQWQVAVTANSGVVTTSNWMTLSTADATPTAAPLSPVDTVIDGSKDVLFQWQHSISTGTAQSKADLQKSTDGQSWTTLATVTGAEKQWTCPAGTLTSSIKYWRVRTYNADGVAGEWSDAAQIVVIAAPPAPSIQIKSTGPRPSISWQTSEQEAYQVELDGVLSGGTHYGTEKTWTSPAYLSDGSHTVRVRVQNQYGMWSDWGAAALPVTNTPGAAITLSVQASSVADLRWQTTGSYDFYLVYRGGKPIAKLTQTQYTDELSSGSVTYQVRGCYAGSSNYSLSQAVTVDVRADVHMVSDLDTGQTLRLPYSDSQHRQTTRTLSRQVELLQLSGAYYPVAVEVDAGADTLSITAALIDEGDIKQLMGLVGKLVCAKTPQGDMVIGYITSLPKQHDGFLNVFSFTVEQIDYDDEVTL